MQIGDRFGKLVITEMLLERNTDGRKQVKCRCDCGTVDFICTEKSLTRHKKPTRSCGCLRLERIHEVICKHGESGNGIAGQRTKLYRTWSNMKSRCYNANVRSYADYGAKGIKMCDEWLHDYVVFRDGAIQNGYQDELTIDRIDANGDYCPENCRWITAHDNFVRAHEVSCWGRELSSGKYVEFTNIRTFAQLNGFSYSCIDRVLHGHNKTHKGWVFGYLA